LDKLEENPLNDNFNCIIKKVNEMIEVVEGMQKQLVDMAAPAVKKAVVSKKAVVKK